MRALSRRTLLAALLLTGATGLLAGGGWLAWCHEPAFYRTALDADPTRLARGSNELLEEASSLLTDLGRQGEWRSLFTAEQINGWLAVDVPKNHASLFPPDLSEPRVALERG
ncbi:MAG: hypothetical protein JNG90_03905, partial [Planctomycetaceae bacterium]|nr:hypothetical protein [Planctomycetaceae bacterium]